MSGSFFSTEDAFKQFETMFGSRDIFSSMFNDPFMRDEHIFSSNMRGAHSFSSSSSSSSSAVMVGGTSKSVSTSTSIVNGKKVTRRTETITDSSGNVTKTVTEETDDGRGGRQIRSINNGGNGQSLVRSSSASVSKGSSWSLF